MRQSYRPDIPPKPQPYRTQILDHLGLVAGMFEELGITEVIDKATQQDPEMRMVTAGHAVKAMVLNGLGFLNHQLSLVPHFFQHKPISRLMAPGMQASHLNDDTLGRALDTLYDFGVTALDSLIAATAAKRLGLTPTFAHLESTSFHVDGRSHSDEPPDAQVIHIPQGDSRDHRPDLNQVMLDLMVEHHAGMPVLRQPLSGKSSDKTDCGQMIHDHLVQWHLTSGTTSVVAESALSSAENLPTLAETGTKWITRVPATLTEAQEALALAKPETMRPLTAGYRYDVVPSRYGGVDQRWIVLSSEHRPPQAQRSVDKRWLKHREHEAKALKKLCHTALACEADAPQAVATLTHGLRSTVFHQVTIHPTPRYGKRGRPSPEAPPARVDDPIAGALASSLSARQQRVSQQSCCLLATNALDDQALSPQAVLEGSKGQQHAERGFRFLKDPQCLASSLSRKKPERIMALLMVMTGCLLVYAA